MSYSITHIFRLRQNFVSGFSRVASVSLRTALVSASVPASASASATLPYTRAYSMPEEQNGAGGGGFNGRGGGECWDGSNFDGSPRKLSHL